MKAKKFDKGPVDKSKCHHTPGADEPDYPKWNAWAAKMFMTHTATQCPECGFWRLWVKK